MPAFTTKVESAVSDSMVTVHVAGTIAEATAKGLFHPSCRHSVSAYLPGATSVPAHTEDPAGDAARQRLRDLERRVRAEKLKAAAAIDPAAGVEHANRAKILQGQIVAHVKASRDLGIKRKPEREEINLGHVRAVVTKLPQPMQGEAALASVPVGTHPDSDGYIGLPKGMKNKADIAASLDHYQASGYYAINNVLRGTEGYTGDAETSRDITRIDKVMAVSRLPQPILIHRGIEDPHAVFGDAWKPSGDNTGLDWQEHSYISATADSRVVNHFPGNVTMNISVPAGAGAVRLSEFSAAYSALPEHEAEVLLQRGMKLHITKDRGIVAGRRVLDVEAVPVEVRPVTVKPTAAVKPAGVKPLPAVKPTEQVSAWGVPISAPKPIPTSTVPAVRTAPKTPLGGFRTGAEALETPLVKFVQRGKYDGLPSTWDKQTRDDVAHALDSYRGLAYSQINGFLRGDPELARLAGSGIETPISLIDRTMDVSRLKAPVMLVRGVKDPHLFIEGWNDSNVEGLEWREKAYISASAEAAVAGEFSVSCHINLFVPPGVGGIKLSELVEEDGEAEVLLERGLKMRVVKDHGVSGMGIRTIDVEVTR